MDVVEYTHHVRTGGDHRIGAVTGSTWAKVLGQSQNTWQRLWSTSSPKVIELQPSLVAIRAATITGRGISLTIERATNVAGKPESLAWARSAPLNRSPMLVDQVTTFTTANLQSTRVPRAGRYPVGGTATFRYSPYSSTQCHANTVAGWLISELV